MKSFKSRLLTLSTLFFILFSISAMVLSPFAEARPGGGRSSGFRGSRGFGSPPPSRYQGGNNGASNGTAPLQSGPYTNPQRGAFMQGMMGGLAGGMIGSMLFGRSGQANGMNGSSGGIGMLEIILIFGIGLLAFRFFKNRKHAVAGGNREAEYLTTLRKVEPGPYASESRSAHNEQDYADELRKFDQTFDLGRFKEEQMDAFVTIQSAWNHRDISAVETFLAPELQRQLNADIQQLKSNRQINRIENISVRGTELFEAWEENGKVFATLRFRSNVLDYTVDEVSGEVLSGDKTKSVKFEESWTFVRPTAGSNFSTPWKLTAIQV